MAKQFINTGLAPNDSKGDPLRIAFTKINNNFDELYLVSNAGANIYIDANSILATNPLGDINLVPLNGKVIIQSDAVVQGTLAISDAVLPTEAISLSQANSLYITAADYAQNVLPATVGGANNEFLSMDFANGSAFTMAITATLNNPSVTIQFLNAPTIVQRFEVDIVITIDTGVQRTLVWPASVKFPGNVQPTLTSTAIIKLLSVDGGATYYASVTGQGY